MPKHIVNPRPPKLWFTYMRKKVIAQYPNSSDDTIDRITAGIWLNLPQKTRDGLIKQYDGTMIDRKRCTIFPDCGRIATYSVIRPSGKSYQACDMCVGKVLGHGNKVTRLK